MLNIRQIYIKRILINWFKKNITVIPINHTYRTRGVTSNNSRAFKARSRIGQRYYPFYLYKTFNMLDKDIKDIQALSNFKKYITEWLIRKNSIFQNIFLM